MQSEVETETFRISTGGLIYRFFTHTHIQNPLGYFTRSRVLLLIAASWLPLFLLAALEGNLYNKSLDLPFIFDLKPHVRYLIVLPLLIVADSFIDPLVSFVLQSIRNSGILGSEDKTKYVIAVEKLSQRKDSILADIIILIFSALVILSFLSNLEKLEVGSELTNWIVVHSTTGAHLSYAGWWFLCVSSLLLQIVLYRWLWRFYLWCEFLFRISRIELNLQPTHPDLAGGLGLLNNGENAFVLIYFSLGSLLSVRLADELLFNDMTLLQATHVGIYFIIVSVILMTIPMFFFSWQLGKTRVLGRVTYGGLGYRLSRAFNKKWGNPSDHANGEKLLKTADPSSVCDYSGVYDVVKQMRYSPISMKTYMVQAAILAIPFFPLVFTKFSFIDVFKHVFGTLI